MNELCLDVDTLHQASLGMLSGDERARVERHVETCANCRAELVAAARLNTIMPTEGEQLPSPTQTLELGSSLGRYLLVSKLGRGASGEVFVAYDPPLDRKVALKVMPLRERSTEHVLAEARLIAGLRHRGIVEVFDVGVERHCVYVAMELATHGSLRSWAADHRGEWRRVLRVSIQAALGLAHAHSKNVLHLDVKPDNVLVLAPEQGVMGDFGLARHVATSSTAKTVVGTPGYIAPEHHRREAIGPAADQFSFCVTLWEALTGERPFGGSTSAENAEAVMRGERRAFTGAAPARLVRVLEKGLSSNPLHRYASMGELVAALESTLRLPKWVPAVAICALVATSAIAWGAHRAIVLAGCEADAHSIRLTDERRASFEAAMVAAVGDIGHDTWRVFAPQLEAAANGVADAAVEACAKRGEDDDVRATRLECVAEARAALETIEQAIATKNPTVATMAAPALAHAPNAARCVAAAVPRTPNLRPPANERTRVTHARINLAAAEALLQLDRETEAIALAQRVVNDVRALSFAPVRAEAHALLGRAQHSAGETGSEENLRLGITAATEGHHDAVAAHAWLTLVEHWLLGRSDFRDAEWALSMAEAASTSAGVPDGLKTLAVIRRGQILHEKEQYADALAHYERALALERSRTAPDDVVVVHTLILSAQVAREQGDANGCATIAQRAYEHAFKKLGPYNPWTGSVILDQAGCERARGNHARAVELGSAATDIMVRAYGEDNAVVAFTRATLVHSLVIAGRIHEAALVADQVVEFLSRGGNVTLRRRARLLLAVADALHRAGRPQHTYAPLAKESLELNQALQPTNVKDQERARELLSSSKPAR